MPGLRHVLFLSSTAHGRGMASASLILGEVASCVLHVVRSAACLGILSGPYADAALQGQVLPLNSWGLQRFLPDSCIGLMPLLLKLSTEVGGRFWPGAYNSRVAGCHDGAVQPFADGAFAALSLIDFCFKFMLCTTLKWWL